MSDNTLIRCPPYCRANCEIRHHPLLVALLNCEDVEDQTKMSVKLKGLADVVNKYKNNRWRLNDNIPDKVSTYNFPMVHWACALGHIGALQWLQEHDFDMTVTAEDKDTGLHRALVCLQETCQREAKKKFNNMLRFMDKTFLMKNNHGNTPLHQSCEYYNDEEPKPEFYIECINNILGSAGSSKEDLLKKMLSSKNRVGFTPLHILCQNDRNINMVKKFISLGAETIFLNSKDISPFDVAVQCGQIKISQMLSGLKDQSDDNMLKKNQPRRGQREKFPSVKVTDPGQVLKPGKQKGDSQDQTEPPTKKIKWSPRPEDAAASPRKNPKRLLRVLQCDSTSLDISSQHQDETHSSQFVTDNITTDHSYVNTSCITQPPALAISSETVPISIQSVTEGIPSSSVSKLQAVVDLPTESNITDVLAVSSVPENRTSQAMIMESFSQSMPDSQVKILSTTKDPNKFRIAFSSPNNDKSRSVVQSFVKHLKENLPQVSATVVMKNNIPPKTAEADINTSNENRAKQNTASTERQNALSPSTHQISEKSPQKPQQNEQSEPKESSQSMQTTEPSKPSEPLQSTRPSKPSEPLQTIEPSQPGGPLQTRKEPQPSESLQTLKQTQPNEPSHTKDALPKHFTHSTLIKMLDKKIKATEKTENSPQSKDKTPLFEKSGTNLSEPIDLPDKNVSKSDILDKSVVNNTETPQNGGEPGPLSPPPHLSPQKKPASVNDVNRNSDPPVLESSNVDIVEGQSSTGEQSKSSELADRSCDSSDTHSLDNKQEAKSCKNKAVSANPGGDAIMHFLKVCSSETKFSVRNAMEEADHRLDERLDNVEKETQETIKALEVCQKERNGINEAIRDLLKTLGDLQKKELDLGQEMAEKEENLKRSQATLKDLRDQKELSTKALEALMTTL